MQDVLSQYEYFKTDKGTLYCGDCTKILPLIEDKIDLVVTSPPYNIGIRYDVWDDRKSWGDYLKWCEGWLRNLYDLCNDDGRLVINHYLSLGNSNNRVSPYSEINNRAINIGFNHHSVVVWEDITLSNKTAFGSWMSPSAPYINSPHECLLFLYKNQWKKIQKGTINMGGITKREFVDLTRGVWKIGTQSKQLTKANFPLSLPLKCIGLLSYQENLVLDPFMGSGTTALAAEKLKRKWIGIEISENYCKVIKQRIENETNQMKMF